MDWCDVAQPARPTHSKLEKLFGEPPWTLMVDDFGQIPHEDTDCVGTIVWRGKAFRAAEQEERK